MKEHSWFLCVLVSAACGGSSSTPDAGATTVFGDTAMVYGQQAKTFAVLQGDTVVQAGLIIPKAAAAAAMSQPSGTLDGFGPLAYPQEVKASTVFDHALIDFYRDGLGAPWTQPFFGAHSFMIDTTAQQASACPAATTPMAAEIPGNYMVLPQGTFPNGGCVAGEGLHAVDGSAPEMQNPPQPFTVSLWIGYSPAEGHWTFLEPFVTTAFMSNAASFDEDVRVPAKYPPAASGKLFPGKFHVALDGNDWKLYYDSFTKVP